MFRYEKRETTKMQPRLYEVTRAIKEQTRRSSGAPLFRTMSATLLCRAKGLHLKEVLDANWPNDHNLAVIAKAETAPATTGLSVGVAIAVAPMPTGGGESKNPYASILGPRP